MNSCWIDWEKITRDFLSSRKIKQVAELRGFYRVNPSGIPRIPPDLELRDYQNTAIISWFRNRGRGTLKMATGSGKTITALAIAMELYRSDRTASIISNLPLSSPSQSMATRSGKI